jgi:hypothetical protein
MPRVYGTITDPQGNKLANRLVRAFDRDLRNEQALGEAITGENGRYSISYNSEQFSRAEKKTADLLMRVYSGDGKKLLYEPTIDNVLFNASESAEINIVVITQPDRTENEFDNIIRVITPLLENVTISNLQQNQQFTDITFLSRETGIRERNLDYLVLAHRLLDFSRIAAAFFYGLFRKNTLLKFDATRILQTRWEIDINSAIEPLLYEAALTDTAVLERDIHAAVQEMIIPVTIERELPALLKLLGSFREKAQQYKDDELPRKVFDLVSRFAVADKIGEIQKLAQQYKNDYAAFFDIISSPKFYATDDNRQSAAATMALAEILGFDDTIIDQVKDIQKIKRPEDVRKLAAMNKADWSTVLTQSAAKIRVAGKPVDKSLIDMHASALARKMETRFPSVAFSAQLQREEKGKRREQAAMTKFFAEHETFDLQKTSVDLYFKDKKLTDPKTDSLRKELKSVQRIFKLIPHYSKSYALIDKNIHSAQSIVAAGEMRFVQEIAPAAGIPAKEATLVFKKAEQVHSASMLMVGELQHTIAAMDVEALNVKSLSAKLKAVSADFPNLSSLFKLTDLCACEHCRSVYSPAAYLVEILQFIDKRLVIDLTDPSPAPAKLAKDVLFERRPDLGDIDLGCENANTPLPYVDLVCELLEEAIAPDTGITYNGALATGIIPNTMLNLLVAANMPVTDKAVIFEPDVNGDYTLRDEKAVYKITPVAANTWNIRRLRQTHSSAEELAAAPDYVNQKAYDELNNKVFAFTLPFNLPHTEATAYFARFDIARAELMKDFQTGITPPVASIAAEILGLTEKEREIIVTPDAANQQSYWNTGVANAAIDMQVVDHFLTKSGLSWKELDVLLHLRFINPGNTLFVQHLDTTCNTAKKVIANLDNTSLDRIHRFLRLMKKTKQKPELLDEMIMQPALGNGTLDNNCLVNMATLVNLKDTAGIKLEELVGWYGTVPFIEIASTGKKSLYRSVFLNKAVNGFIENGLLPEKITGAQQLADFKTTLALSVQISETDFDTLTATFASTTLNFQNLSRLYATARLCRKLKLTVADYLALQRLTGLDVFSSPAITYQFIQKAQAAKTSPIKPADLQFILQHQATNLAEREMPEARITDWLIKLQATYQAAFTANRSPFNASLKADELKEPLKNLLAKLPQLTETAVNNFIRMVDRQWQTPPDPPAANYIDENLLSLFDTTLIKSRQNTLATMLPPTPDYDFEAERMALLEAFFTAIAAYLYNQQKTNGLATAIATTFKTDEELVKAVLKYGRLKQPAPGTAMINALLQSDTLIDVTNTPPVPPVITPAAFPAQYGAIRLLHKLLPLVNAFKLTVEEVSWLLQNSTSLGWFEIDGIPYEPGQTAVTYTQWESFLQVMALSKQLTPVPNPADAEHPVTFFGILDILLLPATTRNEWLAALALLTGYDVALLDELDVHFGYAVPDLSAYRNPATWLAIQKCMEHLRILGVPVARVKEFIKPQLDANDTHRIRMALKARYDENLWLDTLKEIMDAIRPKKRNALVAYLLATHPVKDENDLFDYYLVDVQMGSCMPSSRIVQAHGTIQLFVQRCLMGLEPTASAAVDKDKGWDQWKWMKNYRVWEANRKIFLYPENWIEPELRDDKSFLYKALETELLQNELNEFTATDALINYLEKLDDIAFLEVVATYYQADIYTMHVFARSKGGDPCTYYYRKFEKERYWTPWEKVDLDITSDYLLAFVRNNRLHLAWPLMSESPDPNQKGNVPNINDSSQTGEQDVPKVARKLKVQLAISELWNKKWKVKKVSKEGIETPHDYFTTDPIPRDKFKFFYNQFADQVVVFNVVQQWLPEGGGEFPDYNWVDVEVLAGAFDITGCKGYPELALPKPFNLDFIPKFKDTNLLLQRYRELNAVAGDDLSVFNVHALLTGSNGDLLLQQTPGTFRLTYPHQFTIIDIIVLLFELLMMQVYGARDKRRLWKIPMGTLLPYFMENSNHNYVIIPGFYGVDKDPNTGQPVQTRRTGSDVHRFIEDAIALYVKYMKKLQDDPNHDVNALLQELVADPEFQRLKEEFQTYKSMNYGEQFKNMYHPLICFLRKTLYKDGIPALMKRETQLYKTAFNFNTTYQPNVPLVPPPFPVEDLDFSSDGSYSGYNWETFFHIPLLIATRLTQNQRFEEALTWFHYMFNPTGALDGATPQKYWVTKPFYLTLDPDYMAQRIDTLLYKVADPSTPEIKELEFAIEEWRTKPFMPHVIARFRPVAYQKALLMKYLNNLIEWGDYLFRQDTMESVAQAIQLYIMADKLLGPKPRIIPPLVKIPYQTYNQLEAGLDAFGNALVEFENMVPDLSVLPHGGEELPPPPITLASLYFCIPQNDKMLEYWDRIADRLFKIRHCQNIDGVERSLALFAPPIDPAMLVRAAAAGLDISSVLAGLNAPVPYYRFNVLAQKATELVQEVRGLGSALLQALEKKDAEALSLLRNELELKVLNAVRDHKLLLIKEAKQQIEVLNKTKAVTEERDKYYTGIAKINAKEQLNLDKIKDAQGYQEAAQGVQLAAGTLALIPDIDLGASGFGGSPITKFKFGGLNLAQASKAASDVLSFLSLLASNDATRAGILGGFDRRFDDWKLQERLAKKELKQIEQQLTAAQLRVEMAETDLKNHDVQIENSKKTDEFMRSKYTNKELYDWMISQISAVYFRAYQLSYDVAKKAEKCYQHELGNGDYFLQFGYWDSLKKGLQTADLLYHDIKRMEVSYLDKNKREYELTKHVSLAQLDPLALVRLKATGVCDFTIPEAVYDMDHPGHYFRRIKSVSITLPCIVGPYTSASCKLSLVNNRYRKNTAIIQGESEPIDQYREDVNGNDDRFTYNIGTIQSIAASNAQNDSGLFELNFRDERYLPFEGCGAIGSWRLELPKEVRQFDYNTISDVIIHVKYTAREGGSSLRTLAETSLKEKLQEIKQQLNRTGLHQAINMKYEMTSEWHALKTTGTANLQIAMNRLPYFAQPLQPEIDTVTLIARVKNNPATFTMAVNGANQLLNRKDDWKLCLKDITTLELDSAFTLAAPMPQVADIEELVLLVKYVFA